MEENRFTCPKCGKVFMIPKSHVEEVMRVSLDGDMHNHSGDNLFAMCPSCGYVFAQENPVLIQEFAEISELPEYQAIHHDDPVLNALFHAAFTHLYHPDVYSAAECYLTAGWYAREHQLMQEFQQTFLTAANCFLSYINGTTAVDLDVCNAYFTTIDILRQLKNFSGAEQLALQFQKLLPQIFANLQENEQSDNMSSSLGWVLWYAVATKFEQELIEQRDSSVHYFDEKRGLS